MTLLGKNLGKKDRILRFFIGTSLCTYAYFQGSWIVFASGLFVYFEALMSWCIFYQFIGKSTCPTDRK